MKILQIVPGLSIGGPTYSVSTLTKWIMELGHDIQLYAHDKDVRGFEHLNLHPFSINNFPLNKQLAFSSSLLKELKQECKDADVIVTNSLWQYPNFVMEKVRRGTRAKSVIVPRGTLSEVAFARSNIKKKLILALGQQKALKYADMFIATCEKEFQDIRKFGLTQPVAIIPNGVDIPDISEVKKKKQVLFLGRIHPIKGIDILLKAWSELEHTKKYNDWKLIIAGPVNSDYAQKIISCNTHLKNIKFVGEKNGQEKNLLMAESAFYVLPTHTENFGLTVAESLSCATPVITTKGAPWKGLIDNNCGNWVNLSVENIKNAIELYLNESLIHLQKLGNNGREWIKNNFDWKEIAAKTILSYDWIINKDLKNKPSWIIID